MTKAELIKALEQIPDDFEVKVLTDSFGGIEYETEINDVESFPDEKVVLLYIDDDLF